MENSNPEIFSEKLPKHIAIIMDGNGRWAKTKGRERTFGHRNSLTAVRETIKATADLKIPNLTLYAFSSENWKRPTEEVQILMELFAETLINELPEILKLNLRLFIIGDLDKLPKKLADDLRQKIEETKENTAGNLIFALSYGAHEEILRAVKNISQQVKDGELEPENINEKIFENNLYTQGIPPVDLLIRTGGEVRISNFLLWQCAYAELQFLEVLWPDFSREDYLNCIKNYQHKERRYGKTSEQVSISNE